MKKILCVLLFAAAGFNVACAADEAIEEMKRGIVSDMVLYSTEKLHYNSRSINNSYSQDLMENFIEQLDSRKWYFTKEDVDYFKRYENNLDDELKKGEFSTVNAVYRRLYMKIDLIKQWVDEFLSKPFDFSADEYIETNRDDSDYCKDSKELKECWRKIVKLYTMNR